LSTDLVPAEGTATIGLLAALEEVGGVANDTGLYLPPDLPFDQYVAIGGLLAFAGRMINFYIADWLAHGEHVYGHKFSQAAEVLGKAPQTLLNIQAVGRMVPPSRRRPKTVDFWHHYEIRSLPPNDQRRLLKRAETEHLTKSELRRIVREEKNGAEPQYQDVSTGVCATCGQTLP
jgi:hypothetical protein